MVGIENNDGAPWEKQDEESVRAFEAFRVYRDMGPYRSLDKAYRKFHVISDETQRANRTWFKWSSDHCWVARAIAFDAHEDRIRQQARAEFLAKIEERQFKFRLKFQDAIEEQFAALLSTRKKAEQAPATDVTRQEESIDENGNPVRTKSKVKGILLSGYSRLSKEIRDTGVQAILGPDPVQTKKDGQDDDANEPKSVMPDWLAEALTEQPIDEKPIAPPNPDARPS